LHFQRRDLLGIIISKIIFIQLHLYQPNAFIQPCSKKRESPSCPDVGTVHSMHSMPSRDIIARPPSFSKMLTSLSHSLRSFSSPFLAFQKIHSSTLILFSGLVRSPFRAWKTSLRFVLLPSAESLRKMSSISTGFHGFAVIRYPEWLLRVRDGVQAARGPSIIRDLEGDDVAGWTADGRLDGG